MSARKQRELSLWDMFEPPRMQSMPKPEPKPLVIEQLGGVDLCRCAARGGSASGFRLDERGYWVHAPCGRPTQGWLTGSGTLSRLIDAQGLTHH